MSLSSALRKALAPSLLALMTAFTPAANAADAAPVKYDPARGVIDGDKYTREEASKFVCLGKNPNTGSLDPACSDTNGQLVVYSMKKGSNLVMLTSNLDQTRGLIIERDGKDYAVQSVVADPRFNSDLSSNSVPAWASLEKVAPDALKIQESFREQVAAAHCKGEAGCSYYDKGLQYTYRNGGRIVAVAQNLLLKDGKETVAGSIVIRVTSSGIVSKDFVDMSGASFYRGTFSDLVRYDDALKRVLAGNKNHPTIALN